MCADDGTDIDDAAAGGRKCFTASCVVRIRPSTFKLNCLWKCSSVMLFERREFIDARVVHEDVQPAERLLRFREQTVDVRLSWRRRLHGDGFAARAGDFGDDLVRARFAGGVIDDDRRAFRREMFGDGSADAFGRAGDDGDFAGEFLAVLVLICFLFVWFVSLCVWLYCYYHSNNKGQNFFTFSSRRKRSAPG